jgi:hypothetical protein
MSKVTKKTVVIHEYPMTTRLKESKTAFHSAFWEMMKYSGFK